MNYNQIFQKIYYFKFFLAAISYRPRDLFEEIENYRDRLQSEETSQIKIAAPIVLLIGFIMFICAILLYILRYFLKKRQNNNPYELTNGLEVTRRFSLKSLVAVGIPGVDPVFQRSENVSDIPQEVSILFISVTLNI